MHLITSLFTALCIHAINLKTAADGVGRRLAEHRAQICLLGLKEVQKFWRINNTVLDLFLQYLDESIARRLRGGRDEHAGANTTTTAAAAAVTTGTGGGAAGPTTRRVSRETTSSAAAASAQGEDDPPPQQQPQQQPPEAATGLVVEEHDGDGDDDNQYFHFFLSTNWEGENAIDDLGLILDPQFHQAQSPTTTTTGGAGGPMQLDGLNSLERWL